MSSNFVAKWETVIQIKGKVLNFRKVTKHDKRQEFTAAERLSVYSNQDESTAVRNMNRLIIAFEICPGANAGNTLLMMWQYSWFLGGGLYQEKIEFPLFLNYTLDEAYIEGLILFFHQCIWLSVRVCVCVCVYIYIYTHTYTSHSPALMGLDLLPGAWSAPMKAKEWICWNTISTTSKWEEF